MRITKSQRLGEGFTHTRTKFNQSNMTSSSYQEIALKVGKKEATVQETFTFFREQFQGLYRRGKRGKILFDEQGFALFKKVFDLVGTGLNRQQVKDQLSMGIRPQSPGSPDLNQPEPSVLQTLTKQLETKDKQIESLQKALDQEQQLASRDKLSIERLVQEKDELWGQVALLLPKPLKSKFWGWAIALFLFVVGLALSGVALQRFLW